MAITDAQRRAHDKYFSKAYTQIKLSMPNEEADALRAYCAEHGLTVAGFIRGLIREAIAAPTRGGIQGDGVGSGHSSE